MHARRPFDVLPCEVERDGDGTRTGLPFQLPPQVYIVIFIEGAERNDEGEVGRVEGLAQIGGEGEDGLDEDGAAIDGDPRRLEETNYRTTVTSAGVLV
jgi:hypothetical protein